MAMASLRPTLSRPPPPGIPEEEEDTVLEEVVG